MDNEKYTLWSIIVSVSLFILYYKVREGKINILGLRELQISKEVGFQIQNIKQQKKPQFSKTCQPMLTSGSYQILQNESSSPLNHTECSKSEFCKANSWLPSPKCTWHKYSTQDARNCFKNKKIQLIGDSRARQLYLAMKDRLEGKGWVYDDLSFKVEGDGVLGKDFWKIESNVSFDESNTRIRWDWIVKLPKNFGRQEAKHKLNWRIEKKEEEMVKEINSDHFPDVIIFNSLILHQTYYCKPSHSVKVNLTCSEIVKNYKEAVQNLIPFFKKVAEIGRTTNKMRKIVWMGIEDLEQQPFSILHNRLGREVDIWMADFFKGVCQGRHLGIRASGHLGI